MPLNIIYKNQSLNAYMLIRNTFSSIAKCEDELCSQFGLTSQQLATLLAIKQSPAPVTQGDISNWLDREATSITAIIDNLSKMGLVERKRDLKDRRTVRLIITQKGEDILGKAREPKVQQLMTIMSSLSENETQALIELLKKVRNKTFACRNIEEKVKDIVPQVSDGESPWPV